MDLLFFRCYLNQISLMYCHFSLFSSSIILLKIGSLQWFFFFSQLYVFFQVLGICYVFGLYVVDYSLAVLFSWASLTVYFSALLIVASFFFLRLAFCYVPSSTIVSSWLSTLLSLFSNFNHFNICTVSPSPDLSIELHF